MVGCHLPSAAAHHRLYLLGRAAAPARPVAQKASEGNPPGTPRRWLCWRCVPRQQVLRFRVALLAHRLDLENLRSARCGPVRANTRVHTACHAKGQGESSSVHTLKLSGSESELEGTCSPPIANPPPSVCRPSNAPTRQSGGKWRTLCTPIRLCAGPAQGGDAQRVTRRILTPGSRKYSLSGCHRADDHKLGCGAHTCRPLISGWRVCSPPWVSDRSPGGHLAVERAADV